MGVGKESKEHIPLQSSMRFMRDHVTHSRNCQGYTVLLLNTVLPTVQYIHNGYIH